MKSPILLAVAMVLLCSMTSVYNPTTTHPILSGETFQYEVVKKLMLVQPKLVLVCATNSIPPQESL